MSGQPGMVKRVPMRENQGRARLWQSMRVLRRFTVADIVAAGEVGESAATKYVRFLRQAGYLRVVQPKREGITGGHAVYALVRDTGPHAPRIGNRALRDPNIEPTAPAEMVRIPRVEYERALRVIAYCERLRAAGDAEAARVLEAVR